MRDLIDRTYNRGRWDCSQHGGDGSYWLRVYGVILGHWLTYRRWFAGSWEAF